MKTIVLAAAIAAAPSPAPRWQIRDAFTFSMCATTHQVMNAHAAFNAPDRYGVYVDGREIGRDPDREHPLLAAGRVLRTAGSVGPRNADVDPAGLCAGGFARDRRSARAARAGEVRAV